MKQLRKLIKTLTFGDWCGFTVMGLLIVVMYCVRFLPVPLFPKRLVLKPPVVNAFEERGYSYCFDPIICIRDVGEELGVPNQEIMEMIRIGKAESGLVPTAKNPKSTATGIFQIIIGTWNSCGCSGDRTDFIDNIKCGYKIRAIQGNGAWNESQGVWDR